MLTGQPPARAALDNLLLLYNQSDVRPSWPQGIEIEQFPDRRF